MFKSKWDIWYDNQNEATRAWIDAQSREDNKLIFTSMAVGAFFGFILCAALFLG